MSFNFMALLSYSSIVQKSDTDLTGLDQVIGRDVLLSGASVVSFLVFSSSGTTCISQSCWTAEAGWQEPDFQSLLLSTQPPSPGHEHSWDPSEYLLNW